MSTLLKWFTGFPLRDYLYAGALLAAVFGYLYFVHHERELGEARCVAAQASAQASAQSAIDATAQSANAAIEAEYAKLGKPYTPINLNLPSDCGSVPPDVLAAINAAHKAKP